MTSNGDSPEDTPQAKALPLAYSYVRFSMASQAHGTSVRRQMSLSERFARENGLQLVDTSLQDLGVSAFHGANADRGALGEFLNAAKAGKIPRGSYLLVESLDRLSRQQILHALTLFMDILSMGINIATISDNSVYHADRIDDVDLLQSIIFLSRAHNESKLKSTRGKSNWKFKRENIAQRKLTGRAPSWLKISEDRSEFIPIAERVEVIKRIFDETVCGIGSYTIAKRLNAENISTFGKSDGWQKSYIDKILNSRAVIGEFQPKTLETSTRVAAGPAVSDYFPRIVPEDLFYLAQAHRQKRRINGAGRKGDNVRNIFSGMLKCAYCGSAMHVVNKGSTKKGGIYIVCSRGNRGLDCSKRLWRYNDFQISFLSLVQELDLASFLGNDIELEDEIKRIVDDVDVARARVSELELHNERLMALVETANNGDLSAVADRISNNQTIVYSLETEILNGETRLEKIYNERALKFSSIDTIKSTIHDFMNSNVSDNYRSRSELSSRIRAIVNKILVAPQGGIEGQTPYHRDLARFFIVQFINGSTRSVYPDPNAAENSLQQAFSDDTATIVELSDVIIRLPKDGSPPTRHHKPK